IMPAESVFTVRGAAAFLPMEAALSMLGLFGSSVFDQIYKLALGRSAYPEFAVGVLQRMPWPALSQEESAALEILSLRAWSLTRDLDTTAEVSHAFVVPAVLQVQGVGFEDRATAWSGRLAETERDLAVVQSEIDELCYDLYGFSEEDRASISVGFSSNEGDPREEGDDGEEGHDNQVGTESQGLAAALAAWSVGVGVGRFDVRLATGEREWPVEPDPFDALPVCSPGMLTGEDGLPLVEPPAGYPVGVSPVLVDDPGHELDIAARVRAVFDFTFGAESDVWWVDVGGALGARGGEIAGWLRKGFFDHHLKTYSKSRRKAPILWPVGTASGSYVVWLYAHRVTGDSLFQVLNDIVDPKLSVEQRRLVELSQEAGPNPSASQRKTIDAQDSLVGELRELRDELEAVTPLWAPDLNDGIVIVLAPLWRLFGHHKPWSKELKKHWDKLAAGDFDWAQLAMHLWPERVIPKCAEDRSLAIAHDLEDVFWVQDADNADKWHARTTPTTTLDELIAQRHNPATKAALQKATT
ncbi:BREX-1 system adenine-specific DNA-methyltransferase PglX, partial [Acidimicrobiales bacterium]|nr:BREX-1 system adenine-specific DNA-methyltransferase PglX [Acidimicrobiales bacterium]